ncbi:unnamed protein product [Protopolystoma xenopodis]|uniref:Uncharacterized protein n=1 Tax=Protopolystoma xenopodis TaxID=117903 RepID=A0A3S5AC00_9PLAT|nr:unnamed protein product [Protopolystoma xenopodis]
MTACKVVITTGAASLARPRVFLPTKPDLIGRISRNPPHPPTSRLLLPCHTLSESPLRLEEAPTGALLALDGWKALPRSAITSPFHGFPSVHLQRNEAACLIEEAPVPRLFAELSNRTPEFDSSGRRLALRKQSQARSVRSPLGNEHMCLKMQLYSSHRFLFRERACFPALGKTGQPDCILQLPSWTEMASQSRPVWAGFVDSLLRRWALSQFTARRPDGRQSLFACF